MASQTEPTSSNGPPNTSRDYLRSPTPAEHWLLVCRSLSVGYARVAPCVGTRHSHPELKFAAVFEPACGRIDVCPSTGGTRELRLAGHQVYCVPPGLEHAVHWTTEAPLIEVFLKPGFLETIPARNIESLLARCSLDGAAHDPVLWLLASTMRMLCSHRDSPDVRLLEPMAACFARRLFACHGTCYAPLAGSRLSEDRTQIVQDYIEENLEKKIRVAELAKLVSLSSPHFTLLFRNRTGKAPIDYVREYRRIKAHELIFQGELRMGEISDLCGFCDEPHLNREFKNFFGYAAKLLRTRGASSADSVFQ